MAGGTIFLSHASEDKDFVKRVKDRLDAASVFYDTSTIGPGEKSIEAMKQGVGDASVFVLFHSRHTDKAWVNFEKDLAEVQKIRARSMQILVCPVGDETHHTLPDWMKAYMTTTPDFGVRDIARLIIRLGERALLEREPGLRRAYPGREELERSVTLAVQHAPAQKGHPLSVIVLTGLEGMGKATLAKRIIPQAYKGMREGGPTFSLPDAADAVDLHLRFREDLLDGLPPDATTAQIAAFSRLNPDEQADSLRASLLHWSSLNQVVTLRSRWGFRERDQQIPRWLEALFVKISKDNSLRVVLLSERKLPIQRLATFPHVAQFSLEQLSCETIQFILGELIEQRFQRPEKLVDIAPEIHGHPATANHVAYLVNSGMSLDSLVALPTPIHAFHDQTLDAIFGSGSLSPFQTQLLELLSWFPSLSTEVIAEIFSNAPKADIVRDLWELNAFSLTTQIEGGYYAAPAVVAARFRRESDPASSALFKRVAHLLKERFESGTITVELIDSLVIGIVALQGELPELFRGVITASTLLNVVEQEYNLGIGGSGREVSEHFRRAYEISRMAIRFQTSDDTLENIMFYGADAAVRMGVRPTDLLEAMLRKGFATAHHVEGSYLYHVERDYDGAAKKLDLAIKSKHFLIRNVRLLARIYLRAGHFSKALDVLAKVDEARLKRDTGLIIMKIKALRANRSYKEAEELKKSLGNRENEYGDLAIMNASKAFRDANYPVALEQLSLAERAPKSNKVTLRFLRCAIEIESGDNTNVPEVSDLARAAGRDGDALQLQARAAIVAGSWREAEGKLSQIGRKDYFDLAVELRMLDLKLSDAVLQADPVEMEKTKEHRLDVLRKSASSIEGSRF